MEYTKKLVYQSNQWYNDGLRKAKIHDMSGAIASLKKSLQFNRENIAARNLLGLVYYGRGEVGEALVEWILSKNLKSHDNIANYYIKKIQNSPADLDKINQAIRKYNQSLAYCQQGNEDLAIIQLKKAVTDFPSFLRAHQLMALIFIHNGQYTKARQALKIANKIDTTNEITLRYMHELKENKSAKKKSKKPVDKNDGQTITYTVGNETIIQPVSSVSKESSSRTTFINIVTGIAIGVAVMAILVFPAVNRKTNTSTNKQVVEFSNKIAEEEAQIAALKTELEGFRAVSEETENAQKTATATQSSYETIIEIYAYYLNGEVGDATMVERLLSVDPDALGSIGRERYDEMSSTIFSRYSETLYYTAAENYTAENYDDALANLTTLMQINENYGDGEGMFFLSLVYTAKGDEENAKKWKDKVQKLFPDVDVTRTSIDFYGYSDDYYYDEEYYDDYDYDEYYYDYDEEY